MFTRRRHSIGSTDTMTHHSLMAMFTTSLVVLLLLVFDPATSVHQNQRPSSKGSQAFSSADDWCPAVCPAYPGCPACPAAPPCPRPIPPGYKLYEGLGYYKMHYEEKNWEDAKGACEREGGYLAVIDSQEESELVGRFLKVFNNNSTFILVGFFDIYQNGTYITVLDEPLAYRDWAPNAPNHVGKENCGSFYNNGINDITCHYPSPFLCELLA